MFLGGCLLTSDFRLYVLFTHVFSFHFLRSFISIFMISLVSIFSYFLHFLRYLVNTFIHCVIKLPRFFLATVRGNRDILTNNFDMLKFILGPEAWGIKQKRRIIYC